MNILHILHIRHGSIFAQPLRQQWPVRSLRTEKPRPAVAPNRLQHRFPTISTCHLAPTTLASSSGKSTQYPVVSSSPPLSHESLHSHEHSCPPFYWAASHKPHHFRRHHRHCCYLQVTVTHGALNQRQLEVDVGDEDIFDQFAHAADAKNNDDPHRECLFFRRHTTRLASPGRPSHHIARKHAPRATCRVSRKCAIGYLENLVRKRARSLRCAVRRGVSRAAGVGARQASPPVLPLVKQHNNNSRSSD
jgi:hypothetical protein